VSANIPKLYMKEHYEGGCVICGQIKREPGTWAACWKCYQDIRSRDMWGEVSDVIADSIKEYEKRFDRECKQKTLKALVEDLLNDR
jgi:hypothetical protein